MPPSSSQPSKGSGAPANSPDLEGIDEVRVQHSDPLQLVLRGGPEAAGAARAAVRDGDGVMPPSLRADVLLLLTELVSNAVRHGGAGAEETVGVAVEWRPDWVRVEVSDPGTGPIADVAPRPGEDRSHGLGLVVVERIADRWGVRRVPSGTSVWFEIGSGAP